MFRVGSGHYASGARLGFGESSLRFAHRLQLRRDSTSRTTAEQATTQLSTATNSSLGTTSLVNVVESLLKRVLNLGVKDSPLSPDFDNPSDLILDLD
jgi:hypothetical protein